MRADVETAGRPAYAGALEAAARPSATPASAAPASARRCGDGSGAFRLTCLAGLAFLALALVTACGVEVPRGGVIAPHPPQGPRVVRRFEPPEVIPADLDLVVRIDMTRMRAGIGQAATSDLFARAASMDGEDWLRDAMGRADVVWVALRVADILSGDRILIAEGRLGPSKPDLTHWVPAPSAVKDVVLYDRKSLPPRAGTARVVALGDRALAFVTPVEVASVDRVLVEGPDEKRGDPSADGVISADLRARRLPPALELRFPAIASIVAGISRVRATATLVDEGAKIEAEIIARSSGAAERVLRFLAALRDNVEDARYADALRAVQLDQVGTIVRLRWVVPAKMILGLLAGGPPAL